MTTLQRRNCARAGGVKPPLRNDSGVAAVNATQGVVGVQQAASARRHLPLVVASGIRPIGSLPLPTTMNCPFLVPVVATSAAMTQMPVRILIADDSEQVRSAMSFLIRGLGFEVCGAVGDGEAVIEKAIELKPDLLILDVAMPKRDGWSAGTEIRAFLPNTPILLYTLLPSFFIEGRARELGFQGVVEKTNPTGLIAAIRSALTSRPV